MVLFFCCSRFLFFILCASLLSLGCWDVAAEKSCDAAADEGGVCRSNSPPPDRDGVSGGTSASSSWSPPSCGHPPRLCSDAAGSIYRRGGGSAQAYKPGSPAKGGVCDWDAYNSTTARLRVAGWPLSRSSWRSSAAPRLTLRIKVLSCAPTNDDEKSDSASSSSGGECCCRPIGAEGEGSVVEVWQARPDGSYSSLRGGVEDGDCRAQLPVADVEEGGTRSSQVSFKTVAPGSTGSLGGLGPSRIDFPPYGPPVLHILATAPKHLPTLVDVPILIKIATLEQKSFFGPDFRGPAWVKETTTKTKKGKGNNNGTGLYEITSWTGDVENGAIEIELNLYLQKAEVDEGKDAPSLQSSLCRSKLYGFPSSFFLEPISVCAPSMLDFFSL